MPERADTDATIMTSTNITIINNSIITGSGLRSNRMTTLPYRSLINKIIYNPNHLFHFNVIFDFRIHGI